MDTIRRFFGFLVISACFFNVCFLVFTDNSFALEAEANFDDLMEASGDLTENSEALIEVFDDDSMENSETLTEVSSDDSFQLEHPNLPESEMYVKDNGFHMPEITFDQIQAERQALKNNQAASIKSVGEPATTSSKNVGAEDAKTDNTRFITNNAKSEASETPTLSNATSSQLDTQDIESQLDLQRVVRAVEKLVTTFNSDNKNANDNVIVEVPNSGVIPNAKREYYDALAKCLSLASTIIILSFGLITITLRDYREKKRA